jgi:hypothetical protein
MNPSQNLLNKPEKPGAPGLDFETWDTTNLNQISKPTSSRLRRRHQIRRRQIRQNLHRLRRRHQIRLRHH